MSHPLGSYLPLPCELVLDDLTKTASCPHGRVRFTDAEWSDLHHRMMQDDLEASAWVTERIHQPERLIKAGPDLETPEGRAAALVQNIGGVRGLGGLIGEAGRCRGCRALVYWIRHANLKPVPYTPDGLNHFIDCPKRERFKEGKKA